MANFTRFKRDVLKIIDYALANEIYLKHYVSAPIGCVQKMNESGTTCGAPACIKGYAPVVFPKRFKWSFHGNYIVVVAKGNTTFMAALAGHNYSYDLVNIFDSNNSHVVMSGEGAHKLSDTASDIEVVEMRREIIASSKSFKHLGNLINDNPRWF